MCHRRSETERRGTDVGVEDDEAVPEGPPTRESTGDGLVDVPMKAVKRVKAALSS